MGGGEVVGVELGEWEIGLVGFSFLNLQIAWLMAVWDWDWSVYGRTDVPCGGNVSEREEGKK